MTKTEDTPAAPETTKPRPPEGIRRGRIGFNVGVQVTLGLVLFIMVNVIAHRRCKQWDYTYDRSFTLSATTEPAISSRRRYRCSAASRTTTASTLCGSRRR